MHTTRARAQHLSFQFKCGFKPFRLQLLLLTQVLTATTRRSREFDSNQLRSDCFSPHCLKWVESYLSVDQYSLWSQCRCLSDTTDLKAKYNEPEVSKCECMQTKMLYSKVSKRSGRSPVVGQLKSLLRGRSPYWCLGSQETWKSSQFQVEWDLWNFWSSVTPSNPTLWATQCRL